LFAPPKKKKKKEEEKKKTPPKEALTRGQLLAASLAVAFCLRH
jgi:hypothetical protein